MKKVAIIAIIIIGGGIFGGYMVESHSSSKVEGAKVQAINVSKTTTDVASKSSDKKVEKLQNNKNVNIKVNAEIKKEVIMPVAKESKGITATNNGAKDILKPENTGRSAKNPVENIDNTEKTRIKTTSDRNNSNSSNIINNINKISNNNNVTVEKKSDIKTSVPVQKNVVNNDTQASILVKEYYMKKYPKMDQSDWSTDVSDNQVIDTKTGYLVRLYNYMNGHSNNIAWILVLPSGKMYSTQVGNGPLLAMN